MKIRVDIWGGDCHQNLVESRNFDNDQWSDALSLVRERTETGLLCNVLHLDFQATEEMTRDHAASLLGEKTTVDAAVNVGAVADDLEEVRKAVFGDVGDEPDVYLDYDRCSELSGKMRRAIYALTQSAPQAAGETVDTCPECDGSGLRDSGGVYPWGEYIMVPCDCALAATEGSADV